MTRQETSKRIVDTAIRLFNERGSQTVTTNHIAAAAGISPGNLYYYFRNKEQIVREILERMIELMNSAWKLSGDAKPTLAGLRRSFEQVFTLLRDYRFFQREVNALCGRDPELKRRYVEVRRQRFAELAGFFRGLRESGVLKGPREPAAQRNRAMIGWLVNDYWFSYLELEDRPIDAEAISQGVELMIEGMRPYMTPEDFAELSRASRPDSPKEEP